MNAFLIPLNSRLIKPNKTIRDESRRPWSVNTPRTNFTVVNSVSTKFYYNNTDVCKGKCLCKKNL